MTLGLICLLVGGIILSIALIIDFDVDDANGGSILGCIGTLVLIAGCFLISDGKNPEAIDVYRNKTTLKVTYIDSVAVDSVVVFK